MTPKWLWPAVLGLLAAINPSVAKGIWSFERLKSTGNQKVARRVKDIEAGNQTRKDMLGQLLEIVWDRGEKVDWSVKDVEQEGFAAMLVTMLQPARSVPRRPTVADFRLGSPAMTLSPCI